MKRLIPPLCLVLCRGLLITAFSLLSMDAPEPDVRLHRARVSGNEAYRQALEEDLQSRIWLRRGLIGALFVAALALAACAFMTVPGSEGS
jgi:hypothetical protein